MSVIGFSSSAHLGGNVDRMVRYVLQNCGQPYEMINLTELNYSPCRGCSHLCADDNLCKLEDDLLDILPRLPEARALVLGTPSYFKSMNAFMTVFLERLWCFRHQRYPLLGKPYVVVASGGLQEPWGAIEAVEKRMTAYKGKKLGGVAFWSRNVPCYQCGFGRTCRIGGICQLYSRQEQLKLKPGLKMVSRWEDSEQARAQMEALARSLAAALA